MEVRGGVSKIEQWRKGRNIDAPEPWEPITIPEGISFIGDARHCDDYIDDPAQPDCLREFLEFRRSPAVYQYQHPEKETELYARTNSGVINFRSGTPVRVVMASRLGDVGITRDLSRQHGYEVRVTLDCLDGFSVERPAAEGERNGD